MKKGKRRVKLNCRCGTGNYCHEHWAYDAFKTRSGIPATMRVASDCHLTSAVPHVNQQCGGGIRVTRKRASEI
jgi:hypothetical protein